MKKRKHIILAALLMAAILPARGQILTMDDEENFRTAGELEEWGRIPYHNVDYDQANAYAPLGEGIFLLGALGGAYLLKKKRKKQTNNEELI